MRIRTLLSLLMMSLGSLATWHSVQADSPSTAPIITEIILQDDPGFVRAPVPVNKIVLRADGTLYWLRGFHGLQSDNIRPTQLRYPLTPEVFRRVAQQFKKAKFSQFLEVYPHRAEQVLPSDGPCVRLSVVTNGKLKLVYNYSSLGPDNLWMLEMLVRGTAANIERMHTRPLLRQRIDGKRKTN